MTGVAGVSPAPSGLFTSGIVKGGQPGVAEVPPASSGLFTSRIVKGSQPLTGVAGVSPASFSLPVSHRNSEIVTSGIVKGGQPLTGVQGCPLLLSLFPRRRRWRKRKRN